MTNDAGQAPEKSDIEKLDELFSSVNRSNCPGVTVGVAHRGKTIYRRAFGLASVQHAVANTPTTAMRIGSTSKHFTCLAALLLVEDGKLDIDAPATDYLPELPTDKTVPTLRQFMTHTSGYRCSLDIAMTANGDAKQPVGWTLRTLARQEEYNFEPNHGQMYCNGGYHLLSIAIDRVSGKTMEAFVKERIFEPLGMSNSVCVPNDSILVPGMASLHVPEPDGSYRRGAFFSEDIRGEGNIVSTIDDMLLWLEHMNGEKCVGSEESWRQMLELPTLDNGLKSVYSLGLHRNRYRGIEVVHHAGSVIGGNSQMLTVPEQELNIVILANGVNVNAADLALQVVDTLLGDSLTESKQEIAPLAGYEHLVGRRYHGKSGTLIGFGALGDRLGTSFMGSPDMPILRESKTGLWAGFEHVALGPLSLEDLAASAGGGAPDAITYNESGYAETLSLLPEEPLPIADISDELIGDYYSNDAGANVSIFLENDELRLSISGDYSGPRQFRIQAYSPTALRIHSLEDPTAGCGMTIQSMNDQVTAFQIDGIRARHLRFTRTDAAS